MVGRAYTQYHFVKKSKWDVCQLFAYPCWSILGHRAACSLDSLDLKGNLNDHHIHYHPPTERLKRVRKETIHTWYRNSFSIPPFLSMALGSMVAFQRCFQSELTQQISRHLPFKCLPSIFRTPCHTWCTSNRDSSDFLPNVHPFFSIEKNLALYNDKHPCYPKKSTKSIKFF